MAFHNLFTDLAGVASSRQLIKSHRQVIPLSLKHPAQPAT
jgi:hypothetical protein